jgi:hypothetical protein
MPKTIYTFSIALIITVCSEIVLTDSVLDNVSFEVVKYSHRIRKIVKNMQVVVI